MPWNVPKLSSASQWTCLRNDLMVNVPTSQIPFLLGPPSVPESSNLNLEYDKNQYFYAIIPFFNNMIAGNLHTIPILAVLPNGANLMSQTSICLLSTSNARLNPFKMNRVVFGVWNQSNRNLEQWCQKIIGGVSCAATGTNISISGRSFNTIQYSILETHDMTPKDYPSMSCAKAYLYANGSTMGGMWEIKHYNWLGPTKAIPRPASITFVNRNTPDITKPEIVHTTSTSSGSPSLAYSSTMDNIFYEMWSPSGLTASRFVRYQSSDQADHDDGLSMAPDAWLMDHFSMIDVKAILSPCGR